MDGEVVLVRIHTKYGDGLARQHTPSLPGADTDGHEWTFDKPFDGPWPRWACNQCWENLATTGGAGVLCSMR